MNKIILGMPGPWAEDNYEASDHYTTKIGGLPDWPVLTSTIVKPDLLKCSICKSILCLVAQIYAPISSTSLMIEERLIYVFGCLASNCGNTPESWRALRVQRSCDINQSSTDVNEMGDSATTSLNSKEEKHDDDDGHDDDDDDIDLDDLYSAFSDVANTASISSNKNNNNNNHPKATKPKKTARLFGSSTPAVPCFYIYTQEEAFSKKIDLINSSYNCLSIKENQNDFENNSQEKWDEEGYEYDKALNADRTYLKFKKRMDANPQQCFRYSYGGKPLMAKIETVDPRRCCLCGDSRHFEMQLMPPLLYFIESAINENHKYSLENWNWMTLIICTCSKSCSDSSNKEMLINDGWFVAEEVVVLQYE